MKKIVSETIDGSIKDIIQLKTLDASLEYSQLFDALEDCPQEFQSKLVGALNSLGETMQIPPTEVFNKVLCKSDEDEDVKKKLYNWWRAVFEVLSQCDIPDDRVEEYNQKVDDLMAEILKAGDGEATAEEEPEDVFAEEYEPASMKDEAKMLENMDFAIQELGEIATKVQDLVNFVNPYCGTEVNESGVQPKFKIGDVVKVQGVSGMDFYGRDAPIGSIMKIEPPHPDVGVYEYLIKGRSGEFFAYEDELELFPERFTEENDVMGKPGRYGIGDHVLYKGEECVVVDVDEDLRNDEEIYQVSRDSDKVDGLSFNDWVTWDELEPVDEFTEEENSKMKKITKERGGFGLEPDYDDLPDDWGSWNNYDGDEDDEGYDADSADYELSDDERREAWRGRHPYLEKGKDDGGPWLSEKEIIGMKVTGEAGGDNLDAEEFIDMMTNGAGATPLFDPYNGEQEKDGTVVLNVIAHKEQVSYKDVQDGFAQQAAEYGWEFKSFGYSDDLTSGMVDDGNVEIDVVFAPMQQVSENLENELKKGDDGWTTIGQPISEAKVVVDADTVWDVLELLDDDVANQNLTDLINSHVRTEEEIMDAIESVIQAETVYKSSLNQVFADDFWIVVEALDLDVERFKETGEFVDSDKPTSVELEGSTDDIKGGEVKDGEKQVTQDGETKTLVAGEGEKKEMSDAEAATIMGRASATDMDAADIGVSSHEVADPYTKPVCEMTIEQEVDDPWKLSEMLWSQGKENLEELLRSELVGEEDIMMMLEDNGLRNLTSINDAFAFDFPSILDSLGLDGEAWSQNLEIKRKGEEPVDEAKKKVAGDQEAQKIEDAIPVDDKDGFIKIEKDERYGAGAQVAYYAPGSQEEITHAAAELRKALPEYQIYTSDNLILLLPKKNRK